MTIVKVPETVLEYRFERLDYIAIEDHEYQYLEDWDDDEVQIGSDFAVVAWGLDTDNVLPWEQPQFCGRYVSFHDSKEDAVQAAAKLAEELSVPVHME